MFKDTPEGQTHSYNDGCGEPEHNSPDQDTRNKMAEQAPIDPKLEAMRMPDQEPRKECCEECFKWGDSYARYKHPCHNIQCKCHTPPKEETYKPGENFVSLSPKLTKSKSYERVSHTHCWNQDSIIPACGITKLDHGQCCLCDVLMKRPQMILTCTDFNCPERTGGKCVRLEEEKCEGCAYSKDKSEQMAKFSGAHCFCPPQKENEDSWEERYEEKFGDKGDERYGLAKHNNTMVQYQIDFIRDLLHQQRQRLAGEVRRLRIEGGETTTEAAANLLGYNAAIRDALSIISNQKGE